MLLSTAVAAAALLASSACAQAPIEEGSGMSAGEKYAARKAHREAARALQERSPDFVECVRDRAQVRLSSADLSSNLSETFRTLVLESLA